jgi:hypothetical protein
VPTPNINLNVSIRDLTHEVRLARASGETQVERLDRIDRDLTFLLEVLPPGSTTSGGARAEPVVYNLIGKPRSDGSVEFVINGQGKLSLGPRLAEVFIFLTGGESERDENQDLAGWRTRAQILQFLEQSGSRTFRRAYVNNLVHLLRRALQKAGYDRRLIQTNRQRGVRLAYQRAAPGFATATSNRGSVSKNRTRTQDESGIESTPSHARSPSIREAAR